MDHDSAIDILRCLAIGIAVSGGLVLLTMRMTARADTILWNWARKNGFELVHSERCFFTGGFNPLMTSRNQVVYFVKVRDQDQRERSGWVRCGSWAGFIFFSDEAEVKWKETQ